MAEESKDFNVVEAIKDLLKTMIGDNPTDIFVTAGLAYLGYDVLVKKGYPKAVALLTGPLGYGLARTSAGGGELGLNLGGFGISVPVNSQIVGLSLLALLGFECLPWEGLGEDVRVTLIEYDAAVSKVSFLEDHYAYDLQQDPETKNSLLILKNKMAIIFRPLGGVFTERQPDMETWNEELNVIEETLREACAKRFNMEAWDAWTFPAATSFPYPEPER